MLRYAWRLRAPYTMIVNSDVYFPPTQLEGFHREVMRLRKESEGRDGAFVTGRMQNGEPHPFSFYAITRRLVQQVRRYLRLHTYGAVACLVQWVRTRVGEAA